MFFFPPPLCPEHVLPYADRNLLFHIRMCILSGGLLDTEDTLLALCPMCEAAFS